MRYVRYALFENLEDAQAAVEDIERTASADEKVVLVLHENQIGEPSDLRLVESDGKRGLMLGISSGAVAGVVLGIILAAVGVFPSSLLEGAFFGFLGGLLIGGIGGGLFGSGLAAQALKQIEVLHRRGMVLLTMEVAGAFAMFRMMRILRRHHVVATS